MKNFGNTLAVILFLFLLSAVFVIFTPSPTGQIHLLEPKASIGTEDDPYARADMEFLIMRDPAANRVPEGIVEIERAFASTIPVRETNSLAKGEAYSIEWTERGPTNIGGRTRVFALDVINPTTLIAGSVAGGIWRSVNNGSSWFLTTSLLQIHTTSCIVQDARPGKTHIWYVGTGEFRGSTNNDTRWGSLYRGDGIFKSTDNGSSWFLLPSTSSGTPNITDPFDYNWNVATNPANQFEDEVYAATYIGIYRSTNGGGSWGLVKAADSSFTDVAVTNTGVVYAFTKSAGIPQIWRSPDGVNWTNIAPTTFPTAAGRIVIGLAPSNPNVVYFFVQGPNNTPATAGHQLWKYTYVSGTGAGTGGVWENRGGNTPSGLNTQTGYDQTIHVKPDDEHFVLIGGTNLYRSTNGFASGAATTEIGGYNFWPGQNHHPDLQSGMFHPVNPNIYYSGHDGGLSLANDIRITPMVWTNLNNGYNVTQFYSVSIPPDSGSNMILAGAQDNGSLFGNAPGASAWTMVYGGDGTVVKASPLEHDRLYTQYQNGPMHRQTVSGLNVTTITPSGATNQLFVNPIELDPNNPAILYYGAGRTSPSMTSGIWRNDNAPNATTTVGWTAIAASDVGVASGYTRRVSAIGISKQNNPNVVYYGTVDGVVRRLENANSATPVATTITPPGLNGGTINGGFVRAIAVDPLNSNNALVAFGNYNFQNLWYTTNGGATWSDEEGNLAGPGGPSVRWASMFYVDGVRHIFLGTSIGLLSTRTLAGAGTIWLQDLLNPIGNILIGMMDYRASDKTLAVGTHARGVFTGKFTSTVSVDDKSSLPERFVLAQNYPNPFNPSTTITFELPVSEQVRLDVYDINGRIVETLVNGEKEAGEHSVEFTARNLASGIYFVQLQAGGVIATKKMVLIH